MRRIVKAPSSLVPLIRSEASNSEKEPYSVTSSSYNPDNDIYEEKLTGDQGELGTDDEENGDSDFEIPGFEGTRDALDALRIREEEEESFMKMRAGAKGKVYEQEVNENNDSKLNESIERFKKIINY